jgi:hypothetical protein
VQLTSNFVKVADVSTPFSYASLEDSRGFTSSTPTCCHDDGRLTAFEILAGDPEKRIDLLCKIS